MIIEETIEKFEKEFNIIDGGFCGHYTYEAIKDFLRENMEYTEIEETNMDWSKCDLSKVDEWL